MVTNPRGNEVQLKKKYRELVSLFYIHSDESASEMSS